VTVDAREGERVIEIDQYRSKRKLPELGTDALVFTCIETRIYVGSRRSASVQANTRHGAAVLREP